MPNFKTYRAIFRLDFPVLHSLLDRQGELTDSISNEIHARIKNITKEEIGVDPALRGIRARIETEEYSFIIQLNLSSCFLDLGCPGGWAINNLAKHPAFIVADKVTNLLSGYGLRRYNRIGMRCYILYSSERIVFDRFLDYLLDRNNAISTVVGRTFADPKDIGVTIESRNADDISLRVSFGPYTNSELGKYFSFKDSPIDAGLIADLDLWQNMLDIPGFRAKNTVIDYQTLADSIFTNLVNSVESELEQ
jgi:hypothetical protein